MDYYIALWSVVTLFTVLILHGLWREEQDAKRRKRHRQRQKWAW